MMSGTTPPTPPTAPMMRSNLTLAGPLDVDRESIDAQPASPLSPTQDPRSLARDMLRQHGSKEHKADVRAAARDALAHAPSHAKEPAYTAPESVWEQFTGAAKGPEPYLKSVVREAPRMLRRGVEEFTQAPPEGETTTGRLLRYGRGALDIVGSPFAPSLRLGGGIGSPLGELLAPQGPPAISPAEDIAPRTSPFPPLTREQGRDIGRFIGSMIAGAKAPGLAGAAGRGAGAVGRGLSRGVDRGVGRGPLAAGGMESSPKVLPPSPKVSVDVAPPETPIKVAGAVIGESPRPPLPTPAAGPRV